MRDSTGRFLIIFISLILALLVGLIVGRTTHSFDPQFIAGIGLFLVISFFIAIKRLYRPGKHQTSKDGSDSSEVGFVVDTFHDLVAKLKEKETELENLKSFAEEKAVRMEAYNENILQSVPSGVISIDNDMKIRSLNSSAEYMLKIKASEAIDTVFADLLGEPFSKLTGKDQTVTRSEYPYLTRDGRNIWLGITSSVLENSMNEKIGLIFIFSDLTDIKALQTQVELKQRLSNLGEMSAGISHELRNSMSVISGYAKMLSKKVEGANRGTVDAILKEITLMDNIISELLSFAKPSVLTRETIDIYELVGETVSSVINQDDAVKVSFNTNGGISVNADPVLMRQAISNLLLNAKESMPDGGHIEINISRNGQWVDLSISDTGCGMPEDITMKIFLPFFTTKEAGVGLGLALVHKIIVSHGGHIGVESIEGQGTTFNIALPVQ